MLDVQFEESSLTNGFEDIRLHIFSMATEREREYERSEEKCVYVKFREFFFLFYFVGGGRGTKYDKCNR